ncbi:MAG: hypothetical protein M3536_08575, partial [Actinomycetota bacterium]|nr:hypothetical protein [Actinomycetota bacterium]
AVDATNLIANPLLSSGTPTPTSWIADGAVSADYTEGLVTDADFGGKAWQIAYTSAASTGNFRTFTSYTFTGWSVGDVLEFTLKEKVTASSGITPDTVAGLRLQVQFTGGSTMTPIAADASIHGAATHKFRYTIPAGTTAIQISAVIGVIPVGASFTALLGEFRCDNLTTGALLTA